MTTHLIEVIATKLCVVPLCGKLGIIQNECLRKL